MVKIVLPFDTHTLFINGSNPFGITDTSGTKKHWPVNLYFKEINGM